MTAAEIRAQSRRAIHTQFAVPALYLDVTLSTALPLTVRWHGQNVHPIGDFEGAGYAEILERVDRLIFLRDELTTPLRRNGVVTFPAYPGMGFTLDVEQPVDGPVTVAWTVIPDGKVVL